MLNALQTAATLALAAIGGFHLGVQTHPQAKLGAERREVGERSLYRYMLEGVATPEVFASLIKTPADRGDNAKSLVDLEARCGQMSIVRSNIATEVTAPS